jgi:hypothetical protein
MRKFVSVLTLIGKEGENIGISTLIQPKENI